MSQSRLIYGIHAVKHTLKQSPGTVEEIWIQENKKTSRSFDTIIEIITGNNLPLKYISRDIMDEMTDHSLHQGILVMTKSACIIDNDLGSILSADNESAVLLILDGIQDPHNLGACLRTADAAGVNAVILPKNRAVQVNATVKKVACGAAENIPVITVTNLARTMREIRKAGFWLIGTADEARESIYDIDYGMPTALILGGENKGLRTNVRNQCDKLVSIPMQGIVESLNVSVAAGICLYEILRQRNHK